MEEQDDIVDLTKGYHRRLYAGFITGRRICAVSMEAEAFFWRLHAVVDDFGSFHGDASLIRAATQGRREFSLKLTETWLSELESQRLITFYDQGGTEGKHSETFLHIQGFELRQPAGRNGRRIQKFPLCGESGGIQGNPVPPSPSPKPSPTPSRNGAGGRGRRQTPEERRERAIKEAFK